jgi:hypothetical protein
MVWPTGVIRYFGEFPSERKAGQWIKQNRWLTAKRIDEKKSLRPRNNDPKRTSRAGIRRAIPTYKPPNVVNNSGAAQAYLAFASNQEVVMSEKVRSEMISRRRVFSFLGSAAALSLVVPATVMTATDADAQTVGMERRQDRRAGRHERRTERRTDRHERRAERRGGSTAPHASHAPEEPED